MPSAIRSRAASLKSTRTPGASTPITPQTAQVPAAAEGETGLEADTAKLSVGKDSAGAGNLTPALVEDKSDTPDSQTKPGPPEGEVVFDHPPTEQEKAEVRESLDVERK